MEKNCILFSCLGFSDPVRNHTDGPLLHLLRRYRPNHVVIILSEDMVKRCDERIKPMFALLENPHNWNYSPEVEYVGLGNRSCYNVDQISDLIENKFVETIMKYPNDNIIVNLSSGTPQMTFVLSLLCQDNRCPNVIGVQITSNIGTRTTDKNNKFNIEDEMRLNEDELKSSECEPETDVTSELDDDLKKSYGRYMIPEMIFSKKRAQMDRIRKLLDRRDFFALYDLSEDFPYAYNVLIKHLYFRSSLNTTEARKYAAQLRKIQPDYFELYPQKTETSPDEEEYWKIVESYLVLRNLCMGNNINEFLFRLEPLTYELEVTVIRRVLPVVYNGVKWEDLLLYDSVNKSKQCIKISKKLVEEKCHDLYENCFYINGSDDGVLLTSALSSEILKYLLEITRSYGLLVEYIKRYIPIRTLRNDLAHRLDPIKISIFPNKFRPYKICNKLEEIIELVFSDVCDPSVFTVYDRCIDRIKEIDKMYEVEKK